MGRVCGKPVEVGEIARVVSAFRQSILDELGLRRRARQARGDAKTAGWASGIATS